jgi:hypothetical protein
MKAAYVSVATAALALSVGTDALAGKTYSVEDVKGRYAFSFQGELVNGGPIAAAGYLLADGKGYITEAKRTLSSPYGIVNETFYCTLTVDPDGRGSATCPLDAPQKGFPAIESFDFVIADNAKAFRFIGTTPGMVVVGSGER